MAYPLGFYWRSIYGTTGHGHSDRDALAYRDHELARMSQKVSGGWVALLRCPDGRDVHRECSSYEAGKAGCEAWAKRHQKALVAACEAKDRDWQKRRRF